MAILMQVESRIKGVKASYWRVEGASINYNTGKIKVEVSGYTDQDHAAVFGSSPVDRVSIISEAPDKITPTDVRDFYEVVLRDHFFDGSESDEEDIQSTSNEEETSDEEDTERGDV